MNFKDGRKGSAFLLRQNDTHSWIYDLYRDKVPCLQDPRRNWATSDKSPWFSKELLILALRLVLTCTPVGVCMMGPVVGKHIGEVENAEVEPVGGELPEIMPKSATVAALPEGSPGLRVVLSGLWESC